MSWKIKKTDTNSCAIDMGWTTTAGSKKALVTSDLHWDSAQCDMKKLTEDFDMALEANIPIFIFGDLYDAMQGKWDPRASQESLRDEHRGGNYLDLLVDTSFDWFRKYAPVLAMISPGNHETSIQKRHEVNLTERLVTLLRREKSPCVLGTYWGFVVFQHRLHSKSCHHSLHYHHGYGGGGEVSRGLIDHSRTRGQYHADIYVSGHIHRRNYDENILTMSTPTGAIVRKKQLFLRCGAYKDETDGWHAQQGRASRPIGGWLLSFNSGNIERRWSVQPSASAT